jgi:hypothetical protein
MESIDKERDALLDFSNLEGHILVSVLRNNEQKSCYSMAN